MPSIGSGRNGFYQDAYAGWISVPFSPVEAGAGSGNQFKGVCYSEPTDIQGLPASATCKGT